MFVLFVAVVLLAGVDVVHHRHALFTWEGLWGFHALYGFAAFTFVVLMGWPLRALLTRAVENGELQSDALARFPQLLVAPALLALMWNALFQRFAPLDVKELMHAHLDLLFGRKGGP